MSSGKQWRRVEIDFEAEALASQIRAVERQGAEQARDRVTARAWRAVAVAFVRKTERGARSLLAAAPQWLLRHDERLRPSRRS
jgi:hypothetical protein